MTKGGKKKGEGGLYAEDENSSPHHYISRVFRSSFPSAEETSFRTNAWKSGVAEKPEELTPLHPTLLHAFAMAAKQDDTTGITLVAESKFEPEVHRSYRDLYNAARCVAGGLAEMGVRKGDRVLIVLPTSHEFVIVFFAIQLLNAIPVPSYPPASLEKAELALERLGRIVARAEVWWCVTNKQLRAVLGQLAFVKPVKQLVDVAQLLGGDPERAPRAAAFPEETAFLQFTSGSTGHPKGVDLPHRSVLSNIHAVGQATKITRKDKMVTWLPLYHDMGLIGGVLYPIYWRLPIVMMAPTTFLREPARWLRMISKHKGTLSASPNFAFALCVKRVEAAERHGLDLSSWRVAYNGAEPIHLKTLMDFFKVYGAYGFQPQTMLPVYGLAESSLAVAFARYGAPIQYEALDREALAAGHAVAAGGHKSAVVVCVGRPVPGHDVLVVDDKCTQLPEREIGHVVARGPSIMRGYYRDEKATAQVLRDGWLWTGDLGYFANGELYITGRAKDLIIVHGRNYYAEDLERVAERDDAVRPGGTAAFGVYDEAKAIDLVVLVIETKEKTPAKREAMVEQIGEEVSEHCGLRIDEVVLVEPGTIPRTSSGKRQRSLCRELYLKGELEKSRTGKLRLAMVFARSGAGLLVSRARRLLSSRRPPD